MKLLEERPWSAALRDELARQLADADADDILRAAARSPAVGRGFRPDKSNLSRFRRGLASLAEANLSEADLEALRWCTVWKDIVCVLSVKALTDGFESMAAFIGGVRLVMGMLVDPREEVRRRALAALDAEAAGRLLPPVPEDPEAARERLAETFEPFVRLFSAATLAPNVTRIDRTGEDRERIRRLEAEVAALTAGRTAEAKARREAERAAAEATRAQRHADEAADAARAEATAARTATDEARAEAGRAAEERDTLADELQRVRNDLRTLESFRDECFRLREREGQLRRENDALRAETAALREEASRRAEAAAPGSEAEAAALLRASVAVAPEPEAPPRLGDRERLAAITRPSPPPPDAPLHLVIDGHNVLNVAPEYVTMAQAPEPPSHGELRADLERRLVALAARLAPCEVDLHFDGPEDNLYRPAPGVRVRFSGGTGDHRADRVALDELAFYAGLGGATFVTVTEDADFAAEARRLGSRTVRSGEFARLLFG